MPKEELSFCDVDLINFTRFERLTRKRKDFQKTVSLSPVVLRNSSAGRLCEGEGKQNRKSEK